MKKNKYSHLSFTELLIEYDKSLKRLEEIRKPDSQIVNQKVKEIWGDKPKGLSEEQKKQLDKVLSLL